MRPLFWTNVLFHLIDFLLYLTLEVRSAGLSRPLIDCLTHPLEVFKLQLGIDGNEPLVQPNSELDLLAVCERIVFLVLPRGQLVCDQGSDDDFSQLPAELLGLEEIIELPDLTLQLAQT